MEDNSNIQKGNMVHPEVYGALINALADSIETIERMENMMKYEFVYRETVLHVFECPICRAIVVAGRETCNEHDSDYEVDPDVLTAIRKTLDFWRRMGREAELLEDHSKMCCEEIMGTTNRWARASC